MIIILFFVLSITNNSYCAQQPYRIPPSSNLHSASFSTPPAQDSFFNETVPPLRLGQSFDSVQQNIAGLTAPTFTAPPCYPYIPVQTTTTTQNSLVQPNVHHPAQVLFTQQQYAAPTSTFPAYQAPETPVSSAYHTSSNNNFSFHNDAIIQNSLIDELVFIDEALLCVFIDNVITDCHRTPSPSPQGKPFVPLMTLLFRSIRERLAITHSLDREAKDLITYMQLAKKQIMNARETYKNGVFGYRKDVLKNNFSYVIQKIFTRENEQVIPKIYQSQAFPIKRTLTMVLKEHIKDDSFFIITSPIPLIILTLMIEELEKKRLPQSFLFSLKQLQTHDDSYKISINLHYD